MIQSGSVCLRCRARLACSPPSQAAVDSSRWLHTQQRSMAQLQRRRPARMELSEGVDRRQPAADARPRMKSNRNSPFGGMNRVKAFIPESSTKSRVRAGHQADEKISGGGRSSHRALTNDRSGGKTNQDIFKALKMQRQLAPYSYTNRSAVKASIASIETFDKFPLLPLVQDSISSQALAGLDELTPTPIQRLAIPELLGIRPAGRSSRQNTKTSGDGAKEFLLAAETGTGKTLAYLLPVIDAIKRSEEADASKEGNGKAEKTIVRDKLSKFEVEAPDVTNRRHPTSGRPRAIILVPTAELVKQTGSLFKSFAHTVKFRASMISANDSGVVIRNRVFSREGIDILVSTPHLLSSIAKGDPNILSQVTHLVLDEADSLLDRSFSPITSEIIDRTAPSRKQLILCSATIPRSLDQYMQKRFPDIRRLATPNLHAIPRRVQLGVLDTEGDRYRGNKDIACADAIWTIGKGPDQSDDSGYPLQSKRIIVFVNEREKTLQLADFLRSKGIDAVALNRDSADTRGSQALDAFTTKSDRNATAADKDVSEQSLGFRGDGQGPTGSSLPDTKVIVMTDIGSRGIDTLAVRHVILYDVPHTTIDFIHRLGRTGRMGRRGRAIVLVGKHDRRDVVREVREAMYTGKALI